MQRVPVKKRFLLIVLVAAFLLLCSAQLFQPAPKLYRAEPEDVPPWAEQGTSFHSSGRATNRELEGRVNLVGATSSAPKKRMCRSAPIDPNF